MTDEPGRRFELECESRDPNIAAVRTCRLVAPVSAAERDDYWLAEVAPPFRGQGFGLGAHDISQVIVATRLRGESLFDSRDRPIPIYVARVTDPSVVVTKTLKPDQIKLILWGDLRPTA